MRAEIVKLILVQAQMSWRRFSSRLSLATVMLATLLCATLAFPIGQSSNPSGESSPAQLVRAAVANEVQASRDTSVKHMFRSRKQTPHGSQTKLYVETREAMVGMVIAHDDQPLTAQQLQAEEDHLAGLVGNPDQLRHKQAQEKEDAARTLRIVKALPDAFLYEYDGAEESTTGLGKTGNQLVRLKFRPNPAYEPPSRVEQVLTGMQGYVLVDAAVRRIARIDGTLFKDVTFGWGFLGHLNKGGHFLVEQSEVGDGTWEITRMSLNITGKILLFKSFNSVSDEVFSDFRRVPADTTFAQGMELLKTERAKLARMAGAESPATAKTPQ